MRCKFCGYDNPKGAKYCGTCGCKLEPRKNGRGICTLVTVAFLICFIVGCCLIFFRENSDDVKSPTICRHEWQGSDTEISISTKRGVSSMAPTENVILEEINKQGTEIKTTAIRKNHIRKDFIPPIHQDLNQKTNGNEGYLRSITFVDTLENMPSEYVTDVSTDQDGSVFAWYVIEKSTGIHDLYVGAEGNIIAPENCEELFSCGGLLEEIHFNGCFDTSNVTNMSDMFAYCMGVEELDLSTFDTSKVTDMSNMFCKTMNLKKLDVSGFDTSSVTSMACMFYSSGIVEVDLRSFDTSNVTTMMGMFDRCQNLKKLDVSSFHTSNVTEIWDMFRYCSSLNDLDLSSFDFSNFSEIYIIETLFGGEHIPEKLKMPKDEVFKPRDISEQSIVFGRYEQDGNLENGPEDIEWLILDVQGDKTLLISRYALDSQPYNNKYKTVTWETCTLRKWLNGAFLDSAFTEEEKESILLTKIDNSSAQGNKKWRRKGGKDTEDKVFLLSYAEAGRYFDNAESRICNPTSYAVDMGADTRAPENATTDSGFWWLRSPGEKNHHAAFVNFEGKRYSNAVGNDYLSIRPAIWIEMPFW